MSHRLSFLTLLVLALVLSSIATASNAADEVRFSSRKSQVGDQALQDVDSGLKIEVKVTQGKNVVQSGNRDIRRTQRRTITVVRKDKDKDRVTHAKVSYDTSEQSVAGAGAKRETEKHPVVGKTYLVVRNGEDLAITYEDGGKPSVEEMDIVALTMDAFGRPNPLAEYLAGRTVRVGETLELPNEVASELLGFSDAIGKVSLFAMKLTQVRDVNGVDCALFKTRIDAKSPDEVNMEMKMEGRLVLEVDTCRARFADFSGPVTLSQTHGPEGGKIKVNGRGKMHVAIESQFRDRATRLR